MRALRPKPVPALDPALLAGAPGSETLALGAGDATDDDAPRALAAGEDGKNAILIAGPEASTTPVVLREIASPVRDQVVAIIDQRPEAATRVVRTWLKQD
jgi:transcription termination factor Rho